MNAQQFLKEFSDEDVQRLHNQRHQAEHDATDYERSLHLEWIIHEDGAEVLCCRLPDGSSATVLSAAEIEAAE